MNAKRRKHATAERKQANAKRNGLDIARNSTLSFVREVIDDRMGFSDVGGAYIDLTHLVHRALKSLEENHAELADMVPFMQLKSWVEGEIQRIMYARGYVFDYPVTTLTFSRVE